MGHNVLAPMVANGKSSNFHASAGSATFNPMEAAPEGGPEVGQGVFRNIPCDFGSWDATAVAIVVGYLANIWSKVQHPGYPDQVDIPLRGVTGSGTFDLADHRDKFPNLQISRVNIIITQYPQGADYVFGDLAQVKGGAVSFFISNDAAFDKDWLPTVPLKVEPSYTLNLGTTIPLSQPYPVPGPYKGASYNTWDLHGDFARWNPFDTTSMQNAVTFAASFTLGGGVKKPPPVLKLVGGVRNTQRDLFPLQWINHLRSTFVPPTPNVNGIWWRLNEGVVADIQIFGTTRDPGVEVTKGSTPVQ